MPLMLLVPGDKLCLGETTIRVKSTHKHGVMLDVPDDAEINPDDQPDAEVAAAAVDPNAHGRQIGGRLPGGVRA